MVASLAETAGNIVLNARVLRIREDLIGGAELLEHAQVHEGGEVRHPGRLLHGTAPGPC
jgi:hypothetical protein